MTLTIELPDELEAALEAKAHAQGITAAGYARGVLDRRLGRRRERTAAWSAAQNRMVGESCSGKEKVVKRFNVVIPKEDGVVESHSRRA